MIVLSSIYRWGNEGAGQLSDLSTVTHTSSHVGGLGLEPRRPAQGGDSSQPFLLLPWWGLPAS